MKEELLLIWKEPIGKEKYIIGELTYEKNKYTFRYNLEELDKERKVGFLFYPGFSNFNKKYESINLFSNIETRLPNKSRPDYLDILNVYGLTLQSSKMDILKATKGSLLTDNYEFVPVFNKNNKIEFDVAGTSNWTRSDEIKEKLRIGNNVLLKRETNNTCDEYTIMVIYDKNSKEEKLGYVPRYYSKELSEFLEKNIDYSAKIERLSFESLISDEVIIGVRLILGN